MKEKRDLGFLFRSFLLPFFFFFFFFFSSIFFSFCRLFMCVMLLL